MTYLHCTLNFIDLQCLVSHDNEAMLSDKMHHISFQMFVCFLIPTKLLFVLKNLRGAVLLIHRVNTEWSGNVVATCS